MEWGMRPSRMWTRSTPVSYTHLDVYKRQAGQSLFAASSASPFLLETTAPRVFPGRGKFVSRYAP